MITVFHFPPARELGRTTGDLCRALLDPAKGGMKADQFIPHFQNRLGSMGLVARLRPTPPGTRNATLTRQWVAQATPCPDSRRQFPFDTL